MIFLFLLQIADGISPLMFVLRILLLLGFILGVGFSYHLYFVFLHKQALKKSETLGQERSWLNRWLQVVNEDSKRLPPS